MPVSKTPRRKAPNGTRAKAPGDAALPDRRARDVYLSATTSAEREDATAKAQEVMYDAWDKTTSRSRLVLARKALALSPLCADAYNLMAAEARTPVEAHDLYAHGLEAAEMALGPEAFKQFDGHFWGFLETRPYMRARHGLSMTLLALGKEETAIEHFRAMLKLNPGDNQGIRYLLLASLLRRDDLRALKTLLDDYSDEWSVHWLYTRALIAYREGHASAPATEKLLKDARSVNEHVPSTLAGIRPAVPSSGGFVTCGGPGEAGDYVRDCGAAWRQTPGAIEWLAAADKRLPGRVSRTTL